MAIQFHMTLVGRMFQPLPITKMSSVIDNFIFSDSDNEDYIVQIEELMLRKQKDDRKHAQELSRSEKEYHAQKAAQAVEKKKMVEEERIIEKKEKQRVEEEKRV